LACGAAGRDLDDLDAGVGEHGVEHGRELSRAVADQELEFGCPLAEVGDKVAGLLSGPGSVGVGAGVKDLNVAGVDLDHEEHVDSLQRDSAVDVEEVAGQHGRRLGAEELSPGRSVCSGGSRRDPQLLEDASDRGGADSAADLEEFALDALVAPGWVLSSELLDQGCEFGVDRRAPGAVRVGPFLGDQAAVPAQDGGRCDQPVGLNNLGPPCLLGSA
jgi:hypothetical protein